MANDKDKAKVKPGDPKERLQKIIARAGVASRRAAEELIAQGQVTVNGHIITEQGFKADALRDRIFVEGRPLQPPSRTMVVLVHKPKGMVTTKNDPENRPTVMDLLPTKLHHLHPVGRLDYDTAGALLLTDDGELTHLLTHPSRGVEKVYWARVGGSVSPATLKKLEAGLELEDGPTAPCKARLRAQTAQNSLVEITLHEGRNRQVRRMLEAVGHPVKALRRVRFAGFDLTGLPVGAHRVLLPGQVHQLRKRAEARPPKVAAAKPSRKPSRPKPTRALAGRDAGTFKSQSSLSKPQTSPPKLQTSNSKPRPASAKPQAPFSKPQTSTSRLQASTSKPQTVRGEMARGQSAAAPQRSNSVRGSKPAAGGTSGPRRTPRASETKSGQHPLARRIERQWDDTASDE